MICELGDVVVIPFPFVDIAADKRRPSLVLSRQRFNRDSGHSICAMITTAGHTRWPDDIAIGDLTTAGLPRACVVRWKVFTLPNEMILKKAGTLGTSDLDSIFKAARAIMP